VQSYSSTHTMYPSICSLFSEHFWKLTHCLAKAVGYVVRIPWWHGMGISSFGCRLQTRLLWAFWMDHSKYILDEYGRSVMLEFSNVDVSWMEKLSEQQQCVQCNAWLCLKASCNVNMLLWMSIWMGEHLRTFSFWVSSLKGYGWSLVFIQCILYWQTFM